MTAAAKTGKASAAIETSMTEETTEAKTVATEERTETEEMEMKAVEIEHTTRREANRQRENSTYEHREKRSEPKGRPKIRRLGDHK